MTTYKYDSVNSVQFYPWGHVGIDLRDHRVMFRTVVKGTWSKKGTSFRVVSKSKPIIIPLTQVTDESQWTREWNKAMAGLSVLGKPR
jgi:hypothetical protein